MDTYTHPLTTVTLTAIGFWNAVIAVAASVLAYLSIDVELMRALAWLMAIDLLTGTAAAFIHQQTALRVFVAGFLSKLIMLTIPLMVALVAIANDSNFKSISGFVIGVFAVTEAISILNNYQKARGKETIPEINAVSIVTKKLRSLLLVLLRASEVNPKGTEEGRDV